MLYNAIMSKNSTYVALLRGINVGGNNKVSMSELKTCFEKLGFDNVVTYINSGNVVFRAQDTSPRLLETEIEKALHQAFSIPISVAVRSLSEMEKLVSNTPKGWRTSTDQKLNVIFLRPTIDKPGILDGLKPKPDIEELHYHPGVLFWSAQTSNLTKSNMIKLSSSPLYKEMTVRIFNTVLKIYDIMKTVDAA